MRPLAQQQGPWCPQLKRKGKHGGVSLGSPDTYRQQALAADTYTPARASSRSQARSRPSPATSHHLGRRLERACINCQQQPIKGGRTTEKSAESVPAKVESRLMLPAAARGSIVNCAPRRARKKFSSARSESGPLLSQKSTLEEGLCVSTVAPILVTTGPQLP